MRKELIERLRDATEGPRMLMGEAADMLEADAVPPGYGWLTACDEEMICYHLGVANLSDSYESAKRKLRALIDLNVAIATDPAINGGMSLQPIVPQEPVAWQYRGRPAVNREWGEWHTVGHKPKGPECTRFMMRPLFAAPPPQPRLTDAEILTLWAQTYVERGTSGIEFARVIEAAVMKNEHLHTNKIFNPEGNNHEH
jgi:hypothetical protein